MGYNTWKSIPDNYKPLPNRINIIITKNHFNEMKYEDENIKIFNDFDFCYKFLKEEMDNGKMLGEKFIIGGAKLYNYIFDNYLTFIDKVYETLITHSFNQYHYVNIINSDITEINFNIKSYNMFKLINNKYMDEDKVKILCNNEVIHGVHYNIYQNEKYINYDEKQYLDLMKSILYKNNIKNSRNSKVISSFGEKMIFDLRKGLPLLTTKRMPFKTILRELLWFIKGSTSNKELNDKNVHIWDGNASKEFLVSKRFRL